MHEFAIIQHLFYLLEHHALENHAKKIAKVVVKIGKLSGIEPHFFQVTFDTFKQNTIAQSAKLELHTQEATIYCQNCQKEFVLQKLCMECPTCHSFQTEMRQGEEMVLESLELES